MAAEGWGTDSFVSSRVLFVPGFPIRTNRWRLPRLDPVRLASSSGLRRLEIRRIETLIADAAGLLLEAWHEYFGN